MKKVMVIFGTRPESIKLAPVIRELKKNKKIRTLVCSTGQHREMLLQVLEIFNLKVDHDLNLMKKNQDLYDISINTLKKLKTVFSNSKPDAIVVQGDTTTAFIASLAAFYLKIRVYHVEAGLRSFNIYSPYPEEANRRFISGIANLHFAPTKYSAQNLLDEGYDEKSIKVTGNTVIDALNTVKKSIETKTKLKELGNYFKNRHQFDFVNKKYILITMHRREKFGEEFNNVLSTIKSLALQNLNINFIYPVHLNPNVKKPVVDILSDVYNVYLIPPMDYLKFIFLMNHCHFILSDSGGVQEECFVFKKPIIVMRDVTEREEAIKAGYAFLTGSNSQLIRKKFSEINRNLEKGFNYFKCSNPYGDGTSSVKISKYIANDLFS